MAEVGVACVVDSSLALHTEWPRVMADYIVPLLQRLYDTGRPLKLAFVCYASSATHPTPLLSKLGFAPPQIIVKDLKDDPAKLGVGQTGSGGTRGMAVLEGLIAALELIDIFKTTTEKSVCHIIHVAASPPDAAERPLWNVSPRLDAVTWETLPQEVQKRDIKYSHVLLQPIGKLSSFHSMTAGTSVQTPWFPVRSHHSVRLSGYPPPKIAGVKRPHDSPSSSADSNQESKRPRVASATQSPKPNLVSQSSPPPQVQPTPSPIIPPANVAVQTRPNPQPTPTVTPATYQKALEHLNDTEKQLKQKMADLAAHQNAGRTTEAEEVRSQIQTIFLTYKRMKMLLDHYRAKIQDQHAQQPTATQNSSNPAAPNPIVMPPTALAPALNPSSEPAVMQHAAPLTAGPSIDPQNPSLGTSQTLNKAHDAQLQKLMEQQRRTPRMGAAVVPQSQPPVASGSSQASAPPPATTSALPRSDQRWEGALTWRGLEPTTHARTELQTKVTLASASTHDLGQPHTWPVALNLTPSKERAIPWFLLQDWLKRTNAVPFLLQPRDVAGDDKAKNEDHFRQLIRLLLEKKIYALTGWPGEGKEHRFMIFPAKGGLAGGFFADGIPELPPTHICDIELESVPVAIAYILTRLPPQQAAQLGTLPIEKRRQWLQALALQQQQMLQQKQMAAQGQQVPNGGNGGNGNVPGGGVAMPGTDGMGGGAPMVMGAGMGQHQRTPSGGGINQEMLQSFMNRSGQH